MNWIKPLTNVEFLFLGIFLISYLIFFYRIFFIANKIGTTARSVIIKFLLRLLYLSLMIVCLLGPNFGLNEVETQALSKDIYVAVDVSKSMDAIDVEPTRLEKIKFELNEKLNQFKSNRIGLIFFSTEAFSHSPLTYDKEAIRMYINKLNTNLVNESGTNLNSVFRLIIEKAKNQPLKNRIIILLLITDGEDFGEIDSQLLSELKKYAINLCVLGVGTTAGGKILTNNGYKKDKSGKEIISKLNVEYLRNLALAQKGSFFVFNNQSQSLNDLFKTIDSIEGNVMDARKMMVANNKYYYFLIFALILMIIDILTTIRTIKL
jgi:Ca-activated chloride channel family protein